jgi:hypothetical protein
VAVTCTNITAGDDDTDASSYSTASVTISATKLYLLSVVTSHASAAPTPTVSGASQTWTQVDSQTFAGGQGRLTVFRAGGVAGSGALTITATSATGCAWILDEFANAIYDLNGGGGVWQTATNSASSTTVTATLGTMESSGNATYGAFARAAASNEAWTPVTNFAEVAHTGGSSPQRSFLTEFYNANDTTVDASWTTSGSCRAIAVEIRFLDSTKVYMTPVTSGNATSAATSFATASVTPDASRLILLGVYVRKSAVTVSTPTASGCGVTWVQVATTGGFPSGQAVSRVTLFRAMGTPTTGAITISLGGVSHVFCAWSVTEYGNVDTGGSDGASAVVQSNQASVDVAATTASVTLAAFGSASNATYGVVGASNATAAFVPGTGFTEIHDQEASGGGTSAGAVESEWQAANDTSVDWTMASTTYGAVAAEIKYLSAAAHSFVVPRRSSTLIRT